MNCRYAKHVWPAIAHASHGDRTNNPNKLDLWVPYWARFNTIQPTITPTSAPVNTGITGQHLTNGWTTTKKSKLRRRKFLYQSSWRNSRNCNPTTTTSNYNVKTSIHKHKTFEGKNEKFELFEDLFHSMLKMQPEMTEAMKIKQLQAHLREALPTFKNISAIIKKTLDHVLIVFRLDYFKPESQATAKKMAQTDVQSEHKNAEWLLSGAQRRCWISVPWERPTYDWQSTQRKFTTPSEKVTQLSLSRKKRIRPICRISRKRTRTQWFWEWCGTDNIHHDSCTLNVNHQNSEQTKIVCPYRKKPGHVKKDCRKRMEKEQEQRNDPSIQNKKPSTSRSFANSSLPTNESSFTKMLEQSQCHH